MKKKCVSVLLAAALCCTLWGPALAAGTQTVSPSGLWYDQDGALLLADLYGKALWKQTGSGAPVLLAGGSGGKKTDGSSIGGYRDGKAADALFQSPWAVAPFGDGWAVSDTDNHAVRLLSGDGTVRTLAGTGTAGLQNGAGRQALFSRPTGLAPTPDGGLFVADTDNSVIRLIGKDGQVTTYAGSTEGCADGSLKTAQFKEPTGLAYADGVLYVADSGNNRICRIENGQVTTLAGAAEEGYTDGSAQEARFAYPQGVTASEGVVYVADTGNGAVRRIEGGQVSTLLAPGSLKGGLAPVSPRGLAVRDGQLHVGDVFARAVLTTPLTASQVPAFSDVPAGSPYASAVALVTERGLMNGVGGGLFGPERLLDRGSFVVILSRLHQGAFPEAVIGGSSAFPDLAPDDGRTPAAAWAGDNEIVLGVDGKLLPAQGITWAEALAMLRRYALTVGTERGVSGDASLLGGISLPDWGADACRWGAANGLIPQQETFAPEKTLTRGEAAMLLAKFISLTAL